MKKSSGYYISVGGGKNQLPIIQKAHSHSAKVITIDKNDLAPGFEYSKIKIIESTHQYRKILNSMSQVPMTEPILGIGCRSFGNAVYTASYLLEKFKIPGTSPASIRKFLNKSTYLSALQKFGIPIPPIHTWASKVDLIKKLPTLNYPLVLKPNQGSAKKEISLFNTATEFKTFIEKNYPEPKDFLLQEFIEGPEITALGMAIGSDFHLVLVTDKITTTKPPFLERAHIAPTRHIDYLTNIHIILQNIVHFFQFRNTPLLGEFKINAKGEIFLIEAAPEVGGEYLADHMVQEYHGMDYFELYFLLSTMQLKKEQLPTTHIRNKCSAIVYSVPVKKSKITRLDSFSPTENESLFFEENLKEIDSSVDPKNGNHSRSKAVGISSKAPNDRKKWLEEVELRMNVEYE